MTRHRSLGGLNSRNLCLKVPEAGKSKIKVLVDLGPCEGPLPCSLMNLSSHGRDRETESFLIPS